MTKVSSQGTVNGSQMRYKLLIVLKFLEFFFLVFQTRLSFWYQTIMHVIFLIFKWTMTHWGLKDLAAAMTLDTFFILCTFLYLPGFNRNRVCFVVSFLLFDWEHCFCHCFHLVFQISSVNKFSVLQFSYYVRLLSWRKM